VRSPTEEWYHVLMKGLISLFEMSQIHFGNIKLRSQLIYLAAVLGHG